ncbi:TIGR03118 family protein [Methylobacterium nigriterrae]|uniref:TIGR03118 family protein n=1 Tax=Methylobacterium nigriterrae TaxID=3127512 RepID=UPI0030137D6C
MSASTYTQTNLVSDGLIPARVVDPNLINPWGVADSPTGPFWVSDNGTGLTTIYDGAGNPIPVAGHSAIMIAAPPGQTDPASPTGQVFNDTRTGFNVSSNGHTAPSSFIFATEDGTLSGWSPTVDSASSVLAVDNSAAGAVYKGLALGHTGNDSFLFAANFHAGTVDVFDSQFHQVGSFTDATLPAGYAPFNTQVLDGHLFVTFALQDADKKDDVAGPGNGFVDEFDFSGHLLHRVASGGPLNSPWGLAIAPSGFGQFSNDLLVGNFGDGTINVFDPNNDNFLGKLLDNEGNPIVIGDLWALEPGNTGAKSDPHSVYFTAGVQDEAHGLFGDLTATGHVNPLYRFFNAQTGDHFFTTSVDELNQILKTQPSYRFEGVVGATPDKGADTQDVFRFFDTATGSHFYTTSTVERDQILKTLPNYHSEGVAFEAYTDPSGLGSSGETMERFFNTNTHVHMYSADPTEISAINSGKEGAGWVDEGKAFTIHVSTDGLLHA